MRRSLLPLSALFISMLCGCLQGDELPRMSNNNAADQGQSDKDMTSPTPDADMGPGAVDLGPDADVTPPDQGMMPDMGKDQDMGAQGPYPKEATITPGADANRLLLKGAVLMPERILDPGEVLIVDGKIACAQTSCRELPQAQGASIVETEGIISPGLIDAHNHLPYNFLPEWVPSNNKLFQNRYQWSDDPEYEAHIAPFSNNRSSNTHFCPTSRWGELRSLVHGTTTMQGQSFDRTCIRGGVRNADHAHELAYDHMRTSIASPRDITDSEAQSILASFSAAQNPTTRYAVHMGEGYEGDGVTEEFASFAGRDPRMNRHQGQSLLTPKTALLIHAVAMTDQELIEAKQAEAHIVWSPSSNMVLYGRTADIDRILQLELSVAIGPDWTVSGEDDMLAELRYAYQFALDRGITRLSPMRLWEMATSGGAYALGLDAFIGTLEPGMVADITVFARRNSPADLHEQVITSRAQDVRLVLIGGKAHFGDANLRQALAYRADCEAFDACQHAKFVCAKYQDNDEYNAVGDIKKALIDILEGNGYPADEQYGRGDELLPLVDCSAQ